MEGDNCLMYKIHYSLVTIITLNNNLLQTVIMLEQRWDHNGTFLTVIIKKRMSGFLYNLSGYNVMNEWSQWPSQARQERNMRTISPEALLSKYLPLGGWEACENWGKVHSTENAQTREHGVFFVCFFFFKYLRRRDRRPYVIQGQITKKELV